MTQREKDYDDVVVPGINYIKSPGFKRDIFQGGAPEEKAARASFIGEILNHQIIRGEAKDKRVTSLADSLRWLGPTFDILYAKEVENGAKIDALSKAFTGALSAVIGGESFDQEKFLASVREATAAGVQDGLAGLSVSGQLVGGRLELQEAPTGAEEADGGNS